jgi:cell division septum initiation protein DivIVA
MSEEIDKILEGLSQEDRLKLLERLIKGAEQAYEENLTVEERVDRLENTLLGGASCCGPRVIVKRAHGRRAFAAEGFGCC